MMTKEEKQLLLIELCERLPYGVIVDNPYPAGGAWDEVINIDASLKTVTLLYDGRIFSVNSVKPYLRPMSSMTDEEREDWYRQSKVDYDCEFKPEPTLPLENCHLSVDWLNKKMFDYRGLIPMGLAIEAKEGMYD